MIDAILLSDVRRGNEKALEQLIDKYAAYVCTIISNATGGNLTREDVEETASDVFFALWQNAARVHTLKAWLGATARNKAKNRLREARSDLPLDEEIPRDSSINIEDDIILSYEHRAVRNAILSMEPTDREIFLRHYYNLQTVATITAETGMTEAAVKKRLVRGKKKLRSILCKQEVFGI